MISSLLIASNNQSKVTEIKQHFAYAGIKGVNLLTPNEFGIASPAETETTFTGNAELKARFYGNLTGLPALADDTGVCIAALDGQPGVYTADWIKEHGGSAQLLEKIYQVLRDEPNKRATAVCALSLYIPEAAKKQGINLLKDQGEDIVTVLAEMNGVLDFSHKDIPNPYGFTTVFVPDNHNKSFALLSFEEKINVSHRAKAFAKLRSRLAL